MARKRPSQDYQFERLNRIGMCQDGSLDEIVIGSPDKVWFHLERMDDTCYNINLGGLCVNINFDKEGNPSCPDLPDVKYTLAEPTPEERTQ